jgi:hypothetical protein
MFRIGKYIDIVAWKLLHMGLKGNGFHLVFNSIPNDKNLNPSNSSIIKEDYKSSYSNYNMLEGLNNHPYYNGAHPIYASQRFPSQGPCGGFIDRSWYMSTKSLFYALKILCSYLDHV